MLLFEFFPAVLAIVVVIVGLMLFVMNRRAANEREAPRTPSQPRVSPDAAADPSSSSRRPSMRA